MELMPGLFSSLVVAAALAIYALTQAGQESNDADDSNRGGGLMQPVA